MTSASPSVPPTASFSECQLHWGGTVCSIFDTITMVTTLVTSVLTLSSVLLLIVTSLMAWKHEELPVNDTRHTGHLTLYSIHHGQQQSN